jgi:hypothetical protein
MFWKRGAVVEAAASAAAAAAKAAAEARSEAHAVLALELTTRVRAGALSSYSFLHSLFLLRSLSFF